MSSNVELAKAIRHGLFGERETVKEAFEYAFDVITRMPSSEQIAATTALYVILNTISKEIIKNEEDK
jgi:hypothetical protein